MAYVSYVAGRSCPETMLLDAAGELQGSSADLGDGSTEETVGEHPAAICRIHEGQEPAIPRCFQDHPALREGMPGALLINLAAELEARGLNAHAHVYRQDEAQACGVDVEVIVTSKRDQNGGWIGISMYDGQATWEYRRNAETTASVDQMRDIILTLLTSDEAQPDRRIAG